MSSIAIRTSMGYEQVWNSLTSLNPFPLHLFLPEDTYSSVTRLRTDILSSIRIDWLESDRSRWIVLALTEVDLAESRITCALLDGNLPRLDSATFNISLTADDEGTQVSIEPHFKLRILAWIASPLFRRKLRKSIQNFTFEANRELPKTGLLGNTKRPEMRALRSR